MGLFNRISNVFKSNANAAVDKLSDPSKEIEQLVLDMEEALRKARGETQKGMATEKLAAARLPEMEKQIVEWGQRAERALSIGDESLAKEALAAQANAEQQLAMMKSERQEAAATAQAQQEALKKLEARLREVKARKATIKAKVNLGKNQNLSQGSLDEFDRMAGRVDDNEARVDAEGELSAVLDGETKDAATNAKFEKLGGGDMDQRLAALKKKLDK